MEIIKSYYGVDFHVNKFTYHVIKVFSDTRLERETKTLYLNELFTKLIPILTKNDYVCIEALSGSFAFMRIIKKHVKEVAVINPIDFKEKYCSKKNDKIDAKKIANRYKYHIESGDLEDDFPQVFIPKETISELRSLFTSYELIKKQTIQLKNRIYSILVDNLKPWDKQNLFKYLNEELIESFEIKNIYKIQIRIIYNELKSCEENKLMLKKQILKCGYEHYEKEISILIGISGISDFIACAIIADMANITRFSNAKKFSSYMRSAPKLNSSNDKRHNGPTDKKGRKLAFSLLLQGLHHICKENPNFLRFYNKNSEIKSKGRVRGALIRKTFVTIFYLLKNNENYKFINKKLFEKKITNITKIRNKLLLEKSA